MALGRRRRFTQQQMLEALTLSKGLISVAARRLNCSYDTIMQYMRRYPKVRAVAVEFRNQMTDIAELKFWDAVHRGEPWAITLQLKTQGRARGYVEQVDFNLVLTKVVQDLAQVEGLTVAEVLAEAEAILASRS
jgi:hypothetical protein